MQKQNIFVENLNMETQTVFHTSGDINIFPCDFERGQQIVAGGTHASQKGRMITEDDGTSYFKHYRHNSGSRYNRLFLTAHGDIKETTSDMIFTLRFPKKYGKSLIKALFCEETEEMKEYLIVK
ncbi:MAG: hypothetical protein IKQ72_10565 [Bacteroidaceae bacterium]|jgi:hypothetical protein|nr:hypothetical protein [Bacteroidaceae bacterium]